MITLFEMMVVLLFIKIALNLLLTSHDKFWG